MSTKALATWMGAVIIGVVAGYAAYLLGWPPSLEKSGLFGDSFGVITCLFSGAAFAGMIITIHMQRNELALQREELAMTREELAKSGEAQAAQVKQLAHAADVNAWCTLAQCYTELAKISGNRVGAKSEHNRNVMIDLLRERLPEGVATMPISAGNSSPVRPSVRPSVPS